MTIAIRPSSGMRRRQYDFDLGVPSSDFLKIGMKRNGDYAHARETFEEFRVCAHARKFGLSARTRAAYSFG